MNERHTILESETYHHPMEVPTSVVLVHLQFNKVTPFVTWVNCHAEGAIGIDPYTYTVDGHYFDNLHDALDDYTNRAERNVIK